MNNRINLIVVTGDSIAQDLGIGAFSKAVKMSGLPVSFKLLKGDESSIGLINTGIGGHTIEMIASRFHRDAIQLKPGIIAVNGGTNDLWGWDTSDMVFEESWRYILDQCSENEIIAVAIGIAPATGFPNDIMKKRDSWNDTVRKLIGEYDGFIFVDAGKYTGQMRHGGDPSNLWDIKPEYDLDGVHFTDDGSAKIAQAILDSISHFL
jgi:lysophospholipase L1-like esterase